MRAACIAELPWRAQANLLLSNCYLHQVLGKLKAECGIDEEERVKHGVERVKGGEERVKEGEVKVKEGEKRVKEGEERVGEEEERVKVGVGDHDVRFDSTGVIIKGLIPVFLPSLAGQCSKVSKTSQYHFALSLRRRLCDALVIKVDNSSMGTHTGSTSHWLKVEVG